MQMNPVQRRTSARHLLEQRESDRDRVALLLVGAYALESGA